MIQPVPCTTVSNLSCFPNPFQLLGSSSGPQIIPCCSHSGSLSLSCPFPGWVGFMLQDPAQMSSPPCRLSLTCHSSLPSISHRLAWVPSGGDRQQSRAYMPVSSRVCELPNNRACLRVLFTSVCSPPK